MVALQLRTNTYPMREIMEQGRDGAVVSCWRYGLNLEMLGHITGQCLVLKTNQIRHHNKG